MRDLPSYEGSRDLEGLTCQETVTSIRGGTGKDSGRGRVGPVDGES